MVTILALIALSWYYMLELMSMNMQPIAAWSSKDIAMLFVMWGIMMTGMMLPSAIPVILLVQRINDSRKARQVAYTSSYYFVAGYLLAWMLYSLIITGIQYYLHTVSLLTPMMKSGHLSFTSLLLLLAGIYQWLPIKQSCLKNCRSPLSLITKDWREGRFNAIKLGFSHGQYCLGCCWILMALLFVLGVMDLFWIAILTLAVFVEKVAPKGEVFAKILGVILIGISILIHFINI
ncbi:DUF2182 domain-containing protein [Shewanella sp. UCD-KL12]|uniref:DUF2182 domain-containing protein n=1 Tax=Shewanella sp. UCD-KL12 TaxID=1917163 RepID=UPI0021163B0D|nr:DUF2182 domain-containing protein [Shewanella sp. UCD-KL12]